MMSHSVRASCGRCDRPAGLLSTATLTYDPMPIFRRRSYLVSVVLFGSMSVRNGGNGVAAVGACSAPPVGGLLELVRWGGRNEGELFTSCGAPIKRRRRRLTGRVWLGVWQRPLARSACSVLCTLQSQPPEAALGQSRCHCRRRRRSRAALQSVICAAERQRRWRRHHKQLHCVIAACLHCQAN
jgi:hypothetical protein